MKQATEDRLTSAKELPYFEGDFWPNVLEESIKELEQEEEERKKEESTAASETTEVMPGHVLGLPSAPGSSGGGLPHPRWCFRTASLRDQPPRGLPGPGPQSSRAAQLRRDA